MNRKYQCNSIRCAILIHLGIFIKIYLAKSYYNIYLATRILTTRMRRILGTGPD